METTIEKDCTALGGLFNAIINDLRGSTPIWEDFSAKATKLHSSLRATVVSISAFLESFQKVADMATGTKGATKEIGSALTRLCIRHKSIENKLKSLTSCVLDTMVSPLQERLEEWKKTVAQLDKDHAKECKKARADIKKAASDTIRLQKKAKKGNKDTQNRLDTALHEVNDKFMQLEDAEKNAIRTALIEERSRFCLFTNCLKPFVDLEIGLLTEVTHLQEIMDNLKAQTSDPSTLPPSSEQVILDLKGIDSNTWSFKQLTDRPSPPSSPSSLGSRKSSMCSSINSINSSSSGSNNQPHSPTHHYRHVSLMSQPTPSDLAPRLTSVSSQDSGFTSQDMLFHRPSTPPHSLEFTLPQTSDNVSLGGESTPGTDSPNSTPSEQASTPSASSTWTNWPDPPKSTSSDLVRPHTISAVYEKNHSRPPLTNDMFEPPDVDHGSKYKTPDKHQRVLEEPVYARPATITKMKPVMPPLGPKPKSKAVAPPMVPAELPAYVNMNEIANMAAEKREQEVRDGQITPVNTGPGGDSAQNRETQKLHNSRELADAIRELEASTAALQSAYNEPPSEGSLPGSLPGSQGSLPGSLPGSSGYDTMDSTPSSSEATIACGEAEDQITHMFFRDRNKYNTLPRNCFTAHRHRVSYATPRPASMAGTPASSHHNGMKPPPPPVRRSSSISTGPISDVVDRGKLSPRRTSAAAATTQPPDTLTKPKNHHFKHPSHVVHKRSRSIDATAERRPPAADQNVLLQQRVVQHRDAGDQRRHEDQSRQHQPTPDSVGRHASRHKSDSTDPRKSPQVNRPSSQQQQHHQQQLQQQQVQQQQLQQQQVQQQLQQQQLQQQQLQQQQLQQQQLQQQQLQQQQLQQQQLQQQRHAPPDVEHDIVERRPHEPRTFSHHTDRASLPDRSPPGVPMKQVRSSENLEARQSHYASSLVQRQASLPNAAIYGVPNLALCHASVVQSLSSKFATINRDSEAGAKVVLKHNLHPIEPYARSHSDGHPLPTTPEEGLYARPIVFVASHEEDGDFPAPPSAQELAEMEKHEYDV